jgi:hypothetical protein
LIKLIHQATARVAALFAFFSLIPSARASNPSLDPSTPAVQRGFALLGVSTESTPGHYGFRGRSGLFGAYNLSATANSGGVMLWIEGPAQPTLFGTGYPNTNLFTSDGESVQAGIIGTAQSGSSRRVIYLLIPGGQPPRVRWINVTMADRGASANWRIVNLPTCIHALPMSTAPRTTANVGGATVIAAAWRAHDYANEIPGSSSPVVNYGFRLARGSGHFEFHVEQTKLEWAPPRSSTAEGVNTWIPIASGSIAGNTGATFVSTPYARYNNLLEVDGEIVAGSARTESVTVKNIPVQTDRLDSSAMLLTVPIDRNADVRSTPPVWRRMVGPARHFKTTDGFAFDLFPLTPNPRYAASSALSCYPNVLMGMRIPGARLDGQYLSVPIGQSGSQHRIRVSLSCPARLSLIVMPHTMAPTAEPDEFVVMLVDYTAKPRSVPLRYGNGAPIPNMSLFGTAYMPMMYDWDPASFSNVKLNVSEIGDDKTYSARFVIPIEDRDVRQPGAQPAAPPWAEATRLDASTPETQYGCTLESVETDAGSGQYADPRLMSMRRGEFLTAAPGGVCVWLTAPAPTQAVSYSDSNRDMMTARVSTGQTVPVDMQLRGSEPGDPSHATYFCVIPGGQPPSVKWIDLSLSTAGNVARWRIVNLPTPVHALSPDQAPRTTVSVDGASIEATAWRADDPWDKGSVGIALRVGKGSGSYAFYETNRVLEWAPAACPVRRLPPTFEADQADMVQSRSFGTPLYEPAPYAFGDRRMEVDGEIAPQSVATESVTFTNIKVQSVPGGLLDTLSRWFAGSHAQTSTGGSRLCSAGSTQTVTTPNGLTISITPLDPGDDDVARIASQARGVVLGLKISGAEMMSYPMRAPLASTDSYRRNHQPAAITISSSRPYYANVCPRWNIPPGAPSDQCYLVLNRMPTFKAVTVPIKWPNGVVTQKRTFVPGPVQPNWNPTSIPTLTLRIVESSDEPRIPAKFILPIAPQTPNLPGIPHYKMVGKSYVMYLTPAVRLPAPARP